MALQSSELRSQRLRRVNHQGDERDWRPTNPLFTLDNALITPHAAYYSEESIHAVRQFAAEEVVRVVSGRAALSPVNPAES